ncbi:MAG: hypothetical protein K5821_12000 [Nitrobacter sp.]|uniref:DUF6731 family protein n=1 Tax=Nitrobacter sp. TaxID=29420 RepID=UPI002627C32D|nr:DUF6731 family protein [Nitrobacter sp.]MCV0387135.1 hypothetical protein [Nitrobacter sp.]
MKIFAYRVVQKGPRTLSDICGRLKALNFEDRYFGGSPLRLEEVDTRAGILLIDLSRERGGHGPGRMSRAAGLSDIRLSVGESFGEDTAIAFDQASGFAALQYNHIGPRTTAIEDYLFAYDLSLGGLPPRQEGEHDQDRFGFRFGALLKHDAEERLRRMGIIHEIAFSISVPGARAADLDAGRSLGDVLSVPLPEGIETMCITMKAAAGRDSALGRGGTLGIINDLQRVGASVKHALVKGRPTRDDPVDKIDLVSERISKDVDLELGQNRRYSRADRWEALVYTLQAWLRAGALR